jgi:WD40-like Beta Propeller Repeat
VKLLSLLVALMFMLPAHAGEGLREELARLQQQTGLRLIWYEEGLHTLKFVSRDAPADKSFGGPTIWNALIRLDAAALALPSPGPLYRERPQHLTITKLNGPVLGEYPEVTQAEALCWSHKGSKLVVSAEIPGTRPVQYRLLVFDLDSKTTQAIGDSSYTSSECFSPDDKQLVYEAQDGIRLYDVEEGQSRSLPPGHAPTWSPDGQWIAFMDGKAFYAVSPAGTGKKLLFNTRQGFGPLYWSPDCRFVAYLSEGGSFFESWKYLDVGLIQIRVRRWTDGADDWVYQAPDVPPFRYATLLWQAGGNKNVP